jgi:hypothetical protein
LNAVVVEVTKVESGGFKSGGFEICAMQTLDSSANEANERRNMI